MGAGSFLSSVETLELTVLSELETITGSGSLSELERILTALELITDLTAELERLTTKLDPPEELDILEELNMLDEPGAPDELFTELAEDADCMLCDISGV